MTDDPHKGNDFSAAFQLENEPVRGRVVRLAGQSVSAILARHDYPPHLATILGETLALAALIGAATKFDGRILVQAEGEGPVTLLVGECSSDGALRGYARFDADGWANLERVNRGDAPHMPQLFGPSGRLGIIMIDANPAIQPYQGIVPLMKATLAECAEDYFRQSEQVPSRIRIAAGADDEGWIVSGLLVQRIAADDARGDTEEAWRAASILAATVKPEELTDRALPMPQLLYRLFHEQGVRLESGQALRDQCTCNEARLVATLQNLPDESLRELVEADGTLAIDCQFCARHYVIPIGQVTGAVN